MEFDRWLDTAWDHELPDDGIADRVRAWAKDGWDLREHDGVLHAMAGLRMMANPSHAVVVLCPKGDLVHVRCLVTTWAFGFGQDKVHQERCKALDKAVTG